MSPLLVAVEGMSDEVVVERLLSYVELDHHPIQSRGGKTNITEIVKDQGQSYLNKCNQAAKFLPWLVVVDLDTENCPVTYRNQLLPNPSEMMLLRIAVRETEAWLLADREHMAKFIGVSINNVPEHPDDEANPKRTLIDLVRRKSPKSSLYQDMVPTKHSHRVVGVGYVPRIAEFVNHPKYPWRPEIAAQHSDSLRRCIVALQRFKENPPYIAE